jgi:crotonobetainyl-CoA:carnitine CoA-transferase CaiB-like acyl-CoA transferase
MVVEVAHPVFGVLREVGCPITFADAAPAYRAASLLGADTAAVLAEAGIGAEELADLRARGVVYRMNRRVTAVGGRNHGSQRRR